MKTLAALESDINTVVTERDNRFFRRMVSTLIVIVLLVIVLIKYFMGETIGPIVLFAIALVLVAYRFVQVVKYKRADTELKRLQEERRKIENSA